MAKIQIKSEKLTPFGGIFSIMEQFDALLSQTIDSTLGLRCKLYGYQYSENFRYFCLACKSFLKKNCHIVIFCCKYLINNKINIWQFFDNCHKMPYIAIFVKIIFIIVTKI